MTDFKLRYVFEGDATRLKATAREVDGVLGRVGGAGGSGGLGAVFGGSVAAAAFSKFTGLVVEGGQAVLDYSSRLEQTKIGFETLMGSAEAASKHLKDLQDFAKATPFAFEDLTDASRRLQGVGIAGAEVIPIMKDIGNAAAAAGASSAELNSITLAFSQIIAKGKLSAEEVNQLAERGIPVWRMLEQQLGKSKGEIIKLAEQGKISSELFLDAFRRFSQMNFGGAMEKQSRTFAGAMSNIKDAVMIESERAFKPFFEKISTFAADVAESLDRQGAQARDAGVSFGMAIGEGIGAGVRRSSTQPGGWIDTLKSLLTPTFNADIVRGILRGYSGLETVDDARVWNRGWKTAQDIANGVKSIPSLKGQLDAEGADKQAKALAQTINDLTSKIAFFGQESEVAAVKQKLINDGVTDFDAAVARNAISLAAQLDKLTAAKKAYDEYQGGLKSAADELKRMQESARFDLHFPERSELDRFEFWVKSQSVNFRELHGEIEKTRASLQSAASITAVRNSIREVAGAVKYLNEQTATAQGEPISPITGAAVDVFASLKSSLPNVRVNVQQVATEIDSFVAAYLTLESAVGDDADQLKVPFERLKDYLAQFEFGDVGMKLFGDRTELDDMAKAFIGLGRAIEQSKIKSGIEEINEVLGKVGLQLGKSGLVTVQLTEFDKWISDPKITAAIKERALAYGMTAEALAELLRKIHMAGSENDSPDPKKKDRAIGPLDQLDAATGRVRDWGDVMTNVANVATEAFMNLGQAIGATLESWVLLGDQADVSMRKMLASVLAGVAAQAATLAIFHVAMGIAALTPWGAAMYGPAPLHFKAAALWGAIAVGTALAGRAVAGDSFKQGGASGGRGSAGATGGGVGSSRERDLTPISRESDDAYISGRRDTPIVRAVEKLIRKLEPLTPMRPGDVLVAGTREKKGFIGNTAVADIKRDASIGTQLGRSMGMR